MMTLYRQGVKRGDFLAPHKVIKDAAQDTWTSTRVRSQGLIETFLLGTPSVRVTIRHVRVYEASVYTHIMCVYQPG